MASSDEVLKDACRALVDEARKSIDPDIKYLKHHHGEGLYMQVTIVNNGNDIVKIYIRRLDPGAKLLYDEDERWAEIKKVADEGATSQPKKVGGNKFEVKFELTPRYEPGTASPVAYPSQDLTTPEPAPAAPAAAPFSGSPPSIDTTDMPARRGISPDHSTAITAALDSLVPANESQMDQDELFEENPFSQIFQPRQGRTSEGG